MMEAPLVATALSYAPREEGGMPYLTPKPPANSFERIKFSYFAEDGDTLESALKFISRSSSLISVDCEGVGLDRNSKLCMIQVATANHIFLFDVLRLGRTLFDKGLRSILENPAIVKVFYDCRSDSDILYHQFGVKLNGVMDVALTEVFFRVIMGQGAPKYLKGYKKSVETYLHISNPYFYKLKEQVSALMTSTGAACWGERPLPKELLEYAAFDVKYLRDLHFALTICMTRAHFRTLFSASSKYISEKRDTQNLEDYKRCPMSLVAPDIFT